MATFHTSIFGCFEDIGSCLCVTCFPGCGAICLSCKNWALVREESCGLVHIFCPPGEYWTRAQIRDRNGMNQDCFGDCLCLVCCYNCVVCQDYREANILNNDGIGSKKNNRKNNQNNSPQIIIQQPYPNYPPPSQQYNQPPPQQYNQPPPGYNPNQGYNPNYPPQ